MKFTVTGVEKVRDVVEAENFEAAEKLFLAKYPAIYEVWTVEEMPENSDLYPDYVKIEGNGTAMKLAPCFWERQNVKNRKFRGFYWRRGHAKAGEWGCDTQIINGQLCIDCPNIPTIHGKRLVKCTKKEWMEDN